MGFIQNDEGVGQRAAAHVGEGGNLDDAFFGQAANILGVEHIVERVVERAEIGEDFFAEIAGEETEGLAGFDGGTGENDALDFVFEERGDGGGHREVGLTGAGGADAKDDRVGEHRLKVKFLAERFRHNRLAVGGDDERLGDEGAHLIAFAAGKSVGDAVEVRRADRHALRAGLVQKGEERFGAGDGRLGGGGARAGGRFDLQPVFASDQFDAEGALGVGEVFLAARVEGAEVTGTREVEGAGGHERRSGEEGKSEGIRADDEAPRASAGGGEDVEGGRVWLSR